MGVEVVERWWNGTWGRLARRDLWLMTEAGRWFLRVRIGDAETGDDGTFEYRDEAAARQELALLLSEYGPWQQLRTQRPASDGAHSDSP